MGGISFVWGLTLFNMSGRGNKWVDFVNTKGVYRRGIFHSLIKMQFMKITYCYWSYSKILELDEEAHCYRDCKKKWVY